MPMMDPAFLPRSVWSGDGKFPHQHPADLYTSVAVTRSIPAGSCFGPCVLLQHTFYDTIAFIAQKCSDKRAKSYVFRVDPEAMRNSALVLSWLRLAQAARNAEEQNTEAFLKAGQLYVRTTRDVQPEEELAVWYDRELSHLLGFTDMSRGPSEEFRCGRCGQVFKNEYPFLAHCRFLCVQVKSDAWGRDPYERAKHVEAKRPHRVTDFHNIARDLEHRRPGGGCSEDEEAPPAKRKYEETPHFRGRKAVLLEKTNISNDDNITQAAPASHEQAAGGASGSEGKLKAKADPLGFKSDVFGEARDAKGAPEAGESSGVRPNASSAFSLVVARNQSEQKSAFCKPSKRTPPGEPAPPHLGGAPAAPPSGRPEELSDAFAAARTAAGYGGLMASGLLSAAEAAPSPFHYAPEHWSRGVGVGGRAQGAAAAAAAAAGLTILPPTFTSFGVSVQNWCAKCNLSFRMTSDLVFHMRSHHKKEFAAESQVRRRREEKLVCPICHEYFRERHHLSRHMTSHN